MTPEKGTDVNFVMRVYDERIHLGNNEDFFVIEKFDKKDEMDIAHYQRMGIVPSKDLCKGRVMHLLSFYTTFNFEVIYQELGEDEELMSFQKD
jgi:hypothetical protein